jgi:hypothetical protein
MILKVIKQWSLGRRQTMLESKSNSKAQDNPFVNKSN